MVPLNLILAVALVIVANDLYQIGVSFTDSKATYHFVSSLLEASLTTFVMGAFVVYGLVKSSSYRKMRILFLAFLLMDLIFDVIEAYLCNGKTSEQVLAAIKQMDFLQFYFEFLLPSLVSCCIYLLTAVSFSMLKPFFYVYSQMKNWQSTLLHIFSGIFYFETIILLLVAVLSSTKH